jgi:hypothetical protein
MANNNYGDGVTDLGIIPTVYPQWMLDKQKSVGKEIKERRLLRKGDADYRLFINHEAFVNGSTDERRKLVIENVLTVQDLMQRG